MRRSVIALWTAGFVLILLVGGAVRVLGRRGPENTARKFDAAIRSGDRDRVTDLLTRRARAKVQERSDDLSITPGDDCGKTESKVGRPFVDGDTAVVPVDPADEACGEPFRLHPEDVVGEWLGAVFGDPGRKAMSEALKGVGSALVEAGKGLQRAGDELWQPKEGRADSR